MADPATCHGSVDDLRQQLIDEFSPWLDQSLILAFLNERDVVKQHDEIKALLSTLSEAARAERATGFDPSGLGSWAEVEGQTQTSDEAGNCLSTENATTVSEFSDTEDPLFTHRPDLTEADKIEDLLQIFSLFKEHTIRFVLKRCDGDIERAFDELLTRQYLEENGDLPKGIEGFCALESETLRPKAAPSRNKSGKAKQKLNISYSVVSPTINDDELEGTSKTPQSPRTSRLPPGIVPLSPLSVGGAGWQPPTRMTPKAAMPDLGDSRGHTRSAAALNRLGPLGRQAASVYIQRSREEARKALKKTSAMAEQLVDQQSSSAKIDLHGVTVLDGVRIAKHRVWQWWDNLGENRDRIAKQQGFTVITGVGRHSAGGVSRLRQAVGAALRNDGWKMETLTGQFYITGRV